MSLTPKQLREKCNEFHKDRKFSNNLVDILAHFENINAISPACIIAVENIFTKILKEKQMSTTHLEKDGNIETPEYKYRIWLQECYNESWEKLQNTLMNGQFTVKLQAMVTLFKFIAAEGTNPYKSSKQHPFPILKLSKILEIVCLDDKDFNKFVDRIKEYLEFKDVQYFIWRAVEPLVSTVNKPDDILIRNFLKILEFLPKGKKQSESFLCNIKSGLPNEQKKNITISNIWANISKWRHPTATHRLLLLALIEHIMPCMSKPIFLTDYLMDSMDVGGAVSVLALQGILSLITKHNIAYPDIYGKLYTLFTPEIFSMKYKARLFYLADIFLTSTHLPESLVAAFAKRLARLSLSAPPQDILIIIPFIGNLILRHKGLQRLINHPNGGDVDEDPYMMEESDPYASRALESSLWEIQTLQNHVLFRVCAAARFINNPLPSVEWNLSNVLENNSDKMFLSELKKKQKIVPVTFEKPTSLSLPKTEDFNKCWFLTM
uniref:CCAAT-binding factor domain-containing protein n=1 Tax=Clastoptera arizonana TaxID=38151 RepID=A0A1B6E3T7_9HEMI